jgi:hypothetical protein
MARQPRVTPPGVPLHIIQRGNNRQAMFHDDEDRDLFSWRQTPERGSGQVSPAAQGATKRYSENHKPPPPVGSVQG